MATGGMQRSQGRIAQTDMGARRMRAGTVTYSASQSYPRMPIPHEFVDADWTADGSNWYIDVEHGTGTPAILFNVYDQDGTEIIPEKAKRDNVYVRVWLAYKPTLTIVVTL